MPLGVTWPVLCLPPDRREQGCVCMYSGGTPPTLVGRCQAVTWAIVDLHTLWYALFDTHSGAHLACTFKPTGRLTRPTY